MTSDGFVGAEYPIPESLLKNMVAGKAYRMICGDKPVREMSYVDLGLPSGTLWADRNIGCPVRPVKKKTIEKNN